MEEVAWMTTREVAAYLRLAVSTVHDWRTAKIGPPAFRVGRQLLWRRSDVESWVLRQGDAAAIEPDPRSASAAG